MAKRLFIPGTGGCIFFRAPPGGGQIQVGSILDLALGRQHELACVHDPDPEILEPLETSDLTDDGGQPIPVEAGGHIRAVYQFFHDSIAPRYAFFDFDWRLDIRLSGQRLLEYLDREREGDRWDIACHSQGGLALLWASILAGAARFRELVRRVVFFGVPIQGTINAATALIAGVDLVPGVSVAPAVVRTWPAIYMMLPRWTVGVPGGTGVELFKNTTWRDANLLAASAGQEGLDPNLLRRARAWKAAMDGQEFEAMAAIERFVIVQGKNLNTRAELPRFPKLPPTDNRDGEVIVRGDGLVPADVTMQLLPSALKDHLDSLFTNVRSHMLLCSELQKFDLCESLFA